MSALIVDAALAAVEKLAPVIISALEPQLQKLLEALPAGMVPVTPAAPAISVEAAVAANLVEAVPAASAAEYAKIKTQIGEAIAIYVTDHPGDDLQSDAAWVDLSARAVRGIAEEGIVVDAIPLSTLRQMIASGIEMYRAGLGTKALAVEK